MPLDSDPADPGIAAVLRRNQECLAESVKKCGFNYAARLQDMQALLRRYLADLPGTFAEFKTG